MFIAARILRRDAQVFDPAKPVPSMRDLAQRARIVAVGRGLMARYGRCAVSMAGLAAALGHGAGTIRRHFPDMDALHAAIVEEHLGRLHAALCAVPQDAPNRQAAQRAAYLDATRAGPGRLADAHLLTVRDRHLLPEDEQAPIDDALRALGERLAGALGPEALSLLDNPLFDAPKVEILLAALDAAPKPAAEPVPLAEPEIPARPAPRRPALDIASCLPQGYRPDPPRLPEARAGPRRRR